MLSIEKKWKSSLFAHSALTFNELFKCYVFFLIWDIHVMEKQWLRHYVRDTSKISKERSYVGIFIDSFPFEAKKGNNSE